jgi:hypothetical protein
LIDKIKIEMDFKNGIRQMPKSGTPSPNPSETPKMNGETHKVIRAVYTTYQLFAVPKDWEMDDISVKYSTLYYKDEVVGGVLPELDMKYADDLTEEDFEDYECYFDCE